MAPQIAGRPEVAPAFPRFEPFPGLKDPHAQTIVARYLAGRRVKLPSKHVEVELGDGDRLSLLDSVPPDWRPGDPVAVLLHGLAGCRRSPYIARVACRLRRLGFRAVRMNMRGAGSGFGLARRFYHAGRSDDLRAVVEHVGLSAPGSPIAIVGFSLGGNVVLKLAAEAAEDPVPGLAAVVAANPPIDLRACADHIRRPAARLYDRNFVTLLTREIRRLERRFPDVERANLKGIATLFEFDDRITAPRNGFRDADDYYRRSGACRTIERIRIPGLVVHAEDDPFIPARSFLEASFPPSVELDLTPNGGHLGFLDRRRFGVDRRWLDARVSDWLARSLPATDRRADDPWDGASDFSSERRPDDHVEHA